MDEHKLSFLVLSCILMIFGLRYALISKDKLKAQILKSKTIKEKGKKGLFVWGIIIMGFGLITFLFFLIITFG